MKEISRAQFLKMLLTGVVFLPGTAAFGGGLDKLRGDRVGWARLKTSSEYWMRHSRSDPVLLNFFREKTTLNIDPTWYAADVEKLDEMIQYPYCFHKAFTWSIARRAGPALQNTSGAAVFF